MKICSRNKRKQISFSCSYTYHVDRLNTKKSCYIYNNPYSSNSGTEDDPRTTMTQGDGQVTQQSRE